MLEIGDPIVAVGMDQTDASKVQRTVYYLDRTKAVVCSCFVEKIAAELRDRSFRGHRVSV
jgi:hypothetical protein